MFKHSKTEVSSQSVHLQAGDLVKQQTVHLALEAFSCRQHCMNADKLFPQGYLEGKLFFLKVSHHRFFLLSIHV